MLNAHEHPLVRILIFYLIGIYLADLHRDFGSYHELLSLAFILLLTTLGFSLIKKRIYKHWFGLLCLSLISIIAFSSYFLHRVDLRDSYFIQHTDRDLKKSKQVIIEVTEILKSTKYQKVISEVQSIEGMENGLKLSGELLVYLPKDDSKEIQPGQILSIDAYLKRIPTSKNPDNFDYQNFLYRSHIYHQAFAKNFEIISYKPRSFLSDLIQQSTRKIKNILKSYIRDSNHLAITEAMLLGDKSKLSKSLYQQFSETGAVHVLAVSGLHVGIITMIIMLCFRIFRSNTLVFRLIKLMISILGVWFFALLTGGSPSVVRAATMFSLFLLGKFMSRKASLYNILSGTALIMLIYDPMNLFKIGFQFSFLALWSIVYFHPKIYPLLQFRSRIFSYIWSLIVLSLSAQILVAPLSIYYFHQFPLLFCLSGIIAIPAATLILATALSLVIFELLQISILNEILFAPFLNKTLEFFLHAISATHQIPNGVIKDIWIDPNQLISIYFIIFSMMLFMSAKHIRFFIPFLAFNLIFCLQCSFAKQKRLNQSALCVYHSPKGTIIDIYQGNRCYTMSEIDSTDQLYLSANHRMKSGIDTIIKLDMQQDFADEYIQWSDQVLHCNSIKINIEPSENESILDADYLITNHKALHPMVEQSICNYPNLTWIKTGKPNYAIVVDALKCNHQIHDTYEHGAYHIGL